MTLLNIAQFLYKISKRSPCLVDKCEDPDQGPVVWLRRWNTFENMSSMCFQLGTIVEKMSQKLENY